MKKTLKKIVICLVIVGVLLLNTPFLIKTNAATENYYFCGKYEETQVSSNSGLDYTLQVLTYMDYDNNSYKIIVRILSVDSYIGDYSDFSAYFYRNSQVPYDSYAENLLYDTYHTSTYFFTSTPSAFEGNDFIELTYVIYCDMSSYYRIIISYENFEDDTNVDFSSSINIGYSPAFYQYVIDGYKTEYYQQGQTDTITTTSLSSWIHNIGQGVNDILSIQIFGQITLGTLVFIPIAMSVVLLLLHVWRRN